MGVTLSGSPDAAAWGYGRLDIVEMDSAGKIQHLAWNGSGWSWDTGGINGVGAPSGKTLVNNPSVVALGDQRLWVSAIDSTGAPWYYPYDFTWGSWTSEGGTSGGGIESSSW